MARPYQRHLLFYHECAGSAGRNIFTQGEYFTIREDIVSAGYEYKDLALGAPFYIGQGVLDVIVHDPRSNLVTHFQPGGTQVYQSPVTIDLQCGCRCTV